MVRLKDANLKSIKAIFYSLRFWQYYLINFLAHVSYYQAIAVFQPDNTNYGDWAFKAFVCLLTGFVYQKFDFKVPMLIVLMINCVLCGLNYSFDTAIPTSETKMIKFCYFVSDKVSWVVQVSSIPRTFGIKYGAVVLAIVLSGRILTYILVHYLIPDEPGLFLITGLASNIIAMITTFFFVESLDIVGLVDRGLIVFKDFGISRSNLKE